MTGSNASTLPGQAASHDGTGRDAEAPNGDLRSRRVARLVERYRDALLRHLKGLLQRHEDAEDVLQETCRRLLDAPRLEAGSARARAYMFRIATHLAYDRFRQLPIRTRQTNGGKLVRRPARPDRRSRRRRTVRR